MSDISPAGVIAGFWRWFWVGVLALMLLGGAALGMWKAHVWLFTQNTQLQTRVLHNSYSYQSATAADLSQKITDVLAETTQLAALPSSSQQYADLHAQRLAEAGLACQDASQLTAVPADETGWVSANCTAGAVNPASPLEK